MSLLSPFFDFFSDDLLEYAIKKGWHDSFRIVDFSVQEATSGPRGIGINTRFKLKNKLKKENKIMGLEFMADGKREDIVCRLEPLGPKEIQLFYGNTYIYYPQGDPRSHIYEIKIKDIFDRGYSKKYSAVF